MRGALKLRVLADQFIALNAILNGREKFFAQPRLDDKPENFPLVDRFNDRVEMQNSGDENPRGIGLNPAA